MTKRNDNIENVVSDAIVGEQSAEQLEQTAAQQALQPEQSEGLKNVVMRERNMQTVTTRFVPVFDNYGANRSVSVLLDDYFVF